MKRGLLVFALFSLLLIAAACGGKATPESAATAAPVAAQATQAAPEFTAKPAAATPVPATPTPAPPKATPTPLPAAETVEAEPTLSPEQLEAIAKLDSYRSVTKYSAEGTKTDGALEKTNLDVTTEFSRADNARHFIMTILDAGSAEPGVTPTPQSVEYYQVGDTMYTNMGRDEGWMQVSMEANPLNDPQLDFVTRPGALFSGLENLKRLRPDEKVNGIDSRRYSFDEKALSTLFDTGDATAKGQIWIAKDGGFVTRYVLDVEVKNGGTSIMAPDIKDGKLHMEFELKDVNKPITIELPKEAASGANLTGFADKPFPVPDGATTVAASANFAIYQTDLAPADVQKFYEEKLAAMGWTKMEGASMATADMASLSFTKGDNQVTVLIAKDPQSGKTQIMANAE